MNETVIESISRQAAICRVVSHSSRVHEPSREVTLGIGILKNPARFDFLVEKATELGVYAIIPLLTERTIPRSAKIDRWQHLCLAAMKQSERCVLPEVRHLMSFDEFLESAPKDGDRFIAHEKSTVPLPFPGESANASAIMCVGPEGGFSDAEIERAENAGFTSVALGPRRLRTETAALKLLALTLHD
jgi:16S rRNA (uracil1498-N3)-methyltransferase